MPFTLTMPKMSPTMEEGAIAAWHKKEGDSVEVGDLLFEVATDKATVEYNAIDSGYLRKILVKDGEEAAVNQPVAIFTEEKDESIEGYQPEGIAVKKPEPQQQEEAVAAEPQKKAAATAVTGTWQQPAFTAEAPLEGYAFTQPTEEAQQRIFASPLARRLAKEQGLDLSTVKGTGPSQRIMSRDLEKAQPAGAFVMGRREAPTEKPGAYEIESLSPMRKVIAQRMQEAKTFVPHFYVTQAVQAEALVAFRDQLSNIDIKVSLNDCVVRACALALRQHPEVNSGFDNTKPGIIRFKTVDVAVAVTVPEGLITPIVRHADFKNISELSLEIRGLAKRAKTGKLEPHEYKGGSFTVSNLGMFGITEFQAILNPPQAGILAVSAVQDVPVVRNGVVVPGKILNISLSVDHRVVDGVAAAQFIKTVQKYLENPVSLVV